MLALGQQSLLSSAHIPWLDGAWCFISFSAVSVGTQETSPLQKI